MNAITTVERGSLALNDTEMIDVLSSSLYPGASPGSIKMVLSYCRAAGFDPMQKPVHIVPMWDGKAGQMRDVVMPGVGLYRTQAARSGHAGTSEPEFGPDVTETIGGQEITFPQWCRVTVKRRQPGGAVDEFTAREFWRENYAVKGGKEKSVAPNAMWTKRPYGQLAKCAEAQALRKAFPEIGSQPAAEEMEGKTIEVDYIEATGGEVRPATPMPQRRSAADHAQAPAQPAAATATTGTINPGQVKYLGQKVEALELSDETLALLLQRHGVAKLDTSITVEQFDALKSELLGML